MVMCFVVVVGKLNPRYHPESKLPQMREEA